MATETTEGIYWLETAPDEPCAPLDGDGKADVVIIGGGFTGLWAAYELKLAEPGLDVLVLEAATIAHGASGRNGGFAMTLLDMSLAHLLKNYGEERARAAHEAVAESVDRIGAVCDEHDIDCDYHKGGLLEVATNPGQERRIEADLKAAATLKLPGFTPLDREALQARVRSPTYRLGFHEEACAVVHPARLARGLKRLVMSQGVRVHEHTPVDWVRPGKGGPVMVRAGEHTVTAEHALMTTNAWARHFPQLRRKVIPLYTYILLTEPLSQTQWDEVGWDDREGIEDKRNYVHYYRRTADGRILWGGSDGVIYRSSKIKPQYDRNDKVFALLESTFRRTFPQAADVCFSHRWGGPVAITVPFVPFFGTLSPGNVHYGFGYNGHGVAPSHTGGRILRDLALGRKTQYTELLFVHASESLFPPQPILWLGAALTRSLLLRQDRRMDRGQDSGSMDPWLLRVLR
ncbi:MAG: FAD-binding oxidoreductase [bacterium]